MTPASAPFCGLGSWTPDDHERCYPGATPPLGSLWDAVQIATQTWTRHHERHGAEVA